MVGIDVSQLTACHWLLLRLAGTAPDGLISQCRRWLGQERALDVGRAVTCAVLSQRIRLADSDIDLLAELLAMDGLDTSLLSLVDVTDRDPTPMHGFAPTRVRVDLDMGVAADRTPGALMTSARPEDDIDSAALLAAVLTRPGEPQPQVEVYPMRADLPSYQWLARTFGAEPVVVTATHDG